MTMMAYKTYINLRDALQNYERCQSDTKYFGPVVSQLWLVGLDPHLEPFKHIDHTEAHGMWDWQMRPFLDLVGSWVFYGKCTLLDLAHVSDDGVSILK